MVLHRKRGTILAKGPQRWLVRVFLGRDGDGKRLYASEAVHGPKTEAQRKLTELLAKRDTGENLIPTRDTLRTFSEQWLRTKANVKPKTLTSYQERLNADILPDLGDVKLADLTPQRIQKWVTGLGKSPRTVQYAFTLLSQMLKLAVRYKYLSSNPAEGSELPRKVRRTKTVLSPEQINHLLTHSKGEGDSLYALWAFLLGTGCRPNEAFALRWENVAEDCRAVRIVQSKTAAGVRTISLPEAAQEALKEIPREADALVFPNSLGKQQDISTVRRRWKEALTAAELPIIRLYDARHSHLTALLAAGVPLKVASERAGHSSISITADVYQAVIPSMDEAASTLFDTLMKGKAIESIPEETAGGPTGQGAQGSGQGDQGSTGQGP